MLSLAVKSSDIIFECTVFLGEYFFLEYKVFKEYNVYSILCYFLLHCILRV